MSGAATTHVEVEEIEATKSEKLLAVVLACFCSSADMDQGKSRLTVRVCRPATAR